MTGEKRMESVKEESDQKSGSGSHSRDRDDRYSESLPSADQPVTGSHESVDWQINIPETARSAQYSEQFVEQSVDDSVNDRISEE